MKMIMASSSLRRLALPLLALLFAIGPAAAKTPKTPKAPRGHDVTDTINANPILTSFAQMLKAAPDVYTFLSSRGPFTVFVPNDSAFTKLPPGTFDALLLPENKERLQDILYFHIINGKRLNVKDLLPLRAMFSCFNEIPLTFKSTHLGISLVNKAKIAHADIHCANGNVNEIDTVLMPPETSLPPLKLPLAATSEAAPAPVAPASTNEVVPVIGTPDVPPH
jgi:uncharacterized surface protein with fasciclin (FAS1) repeats